MSTCPCGLGESYADCCEPFIQGAPAPTAEALMRARYTAYVKGEIDYLRTTLHPSQQEEFDPDFTRSWSQKSTWKGLEIVSTMDGGPEDTTGMVEFIAHYDDEDGDPCAHHEASYFAKVDDVWKFSRGDMMNQPVVREAPKVGRNDPCPCGSGKKYKKCCEKKK